MGSSTIKLPEVWHGRVAAVFQAHEGASTTIALAGGEAYVPLENVYDFNPDGGTALIATDDAGNSAEVVTYTGFSTTQLIPPHATGVIGSLSDGQASVALGIPIPITVNATGDSCVVVGGNAGGLVPTAITDTAGNTYTTPEASSTAGLDGTSWIAHGKYNVRPPASGDIVTATFGTTGIVKKAYCVIDLLAGFVGTSADVDAGSITPADIALNADFNPPVDNPGHTISQANELYFAVIYGSGAPAVHSGTVVATITDGGYDDGSHIIVTHGLQVTCDLVNAGADPSRSMGSASGWGEGFVIAYKTNVTGAFYDNVLVLSGTVAGPHLIDTFVSPDDTGKAATTRVLVQREGYDGGNIDARLPHRMQDVKQLAEGIYDQNSGAAVTVAHDGIEHVIVDVLGEQLDLDGTYIDGSTITGVVATSVASIDRNVTPITNLNIVNADVAVGAAIAYSKLNLTGAILNADLAGSIAYSKLSLTGAILNADLAGSIAYSKLSLTGSIVDGDHATHSITNASIAAGTVTGTQIASSITLAGSPVAAVKLTAPALVSSGLTGATSASRYVGATASGAPASGTFVVGDYIIDQSGAIYICTTGGSPGTWGAVGGAPGAGSITSTMILDGTILNVDINASAAIAYTKLALTGSIVNADIATGAAIVYSKLSLTNSILNADIGNGAAIAYSKLALTGAILNADLAGSIAPSKISNTAVTQGDIGTVTGTMIANTTITNTNIAAGANISASKINGTAVTQGDIGTVTGTMMANLTITNGQISASANISPSKINGTAVTQGDTDTVTSTMILNGTILNTDINASAAIAYSKLNLTGAILNADLAGSIAYSKLSLTGAILNADLAGSIAYSKLSLTGAILNADLAGSIAATKISGTALVLNAANTLTTGGSVVSGTTGLTAAWNLGVDGTFVLPRVTVAQRLAGAVKGQMEWQEDKANVEVFNGTSYLPMIDTGPDAVDAMLQDLGATALPIAFTMDPAGFDGTVTTGTPNVGLTAQRLVGGAFIVTKTRSAVSLRIRVIVAGTGTANYSGMGLFSMASSGDWTFLGDTGANDGTIFNATGNQTRNLRNAADNADLAVALVPGVVYFAAIICGLSSVTVSGVSNSLLNGGETKYFRCGGRNTLTTRGTAFVTQATANLGQFANAPLVVVSGS